MTIQPLLSSICHSPQSPLFPLSEAPLPIISRLLSFRASNWVLDPQYLHAALPRLLSARVEGSRSCEIDSTPYNTCIVAHTVCGEGLQYQEHRTEPARRPIRQVLPYAHPYVDAAIPHVEFLSTFPELIYFACRLPLRCPIFGSHFGYPFWLGNWRWSECLPSPY